jgi:hypothetical protein
MALHSEFLLPALSPFLSHKWSATWKASEDKPAIADITVDEAICVNGVVLPGEVNVKVTQVGPSQVFLDMATPIGNLMVVQAATPISPLQVKITHAIFAAPSVPRFFAKTILWATMRQFIKDAPIWSAKR